LRIINLDKLSIEENQLLNSIAVNVRGKFHILIDKLAQGKEDNIHWVVSNVASRNKYHSPLFLRCCQIILVKKLIEENKVHKVILSDYALSVVFKKYYSKNHMDIIQYSGKFKERIKQIFTPIVAFVKVSFKYCLRIIGRRKINRLETFNNTPITLLDTFVIDSKVGEEGSINDGKYKDRYYPGLLELLSDHEKNGIFYLPTIFGFKNPIDAYKKIRSSSSNFLIRDDFLHKSDFLFALLHPFKILPFHFPKIFISGFDITYLIKQENYQNCCNPNSLEGLVNYRFAYRLANTDVNVRLLVKWYENQAIDKGEIIGFHHFSSNTEIIGYQGFIISKILHHYIYPTNSEYRSQAVPSKVAVIGKGLIDDVKEFCNKIDVITAPAFRNQNVWQKRKHYPKTGQFTILVALPMDLNETAAILKLLYKLPKQISDTDIKFLIKPHPSYGPQQIKGFIRESRLNIDIKTGYFNNILEEANLLISNASITSVESLAKGIPVIIIGDKNGIIQNPIPDDVPEDIWKLCFTNEELQRAISYFINNSIENKVLYTKISELIRDRYFEPVTAEKVRMFLSLGDSL
jgi:hypothetical protein